MQKLTKEAVNWNFPQETKDFYQGILLTLKGKCERAVNQSSLIQSKIIKQRCTEIPSFITVSCLRAKQIIYIYIKKSFILSFREGSKRNKVVGIEQILFKN